MSDLWMVIDEMPAEVMAAAVIAASWLTAQVVAETAISCGLADADRPAVRQAYSKNYEKAAVLRMNSDIVTRLRTWVHAADAASASDLMDEAATVIEVGRCCTSSLRDEVAHLRLTDAERQAMRYMIAAGKFGQRDEALTEEHAATLRELLERLCHGGAAYTGGVSAESETKVADPQPTLTDAEREAIEQAAIRVAALCQRGSQHMAATLRGLLERLGGGK